MQFMILIFLPNFPAFLKSLSTTVSHISVKSIYVNKSQLTIRVYLRKNDVQETYLTFVMSF